MLLVWGMGLMGITVGAAQVRVASFCSALRGVTTLIC